MGRHGNGYAKGEAEKAEQKRAVALKRRQDGWSYSEIAKEIGTSIPTAFKYVRQGVMALKALQEKEAAILFPIELSRLEKMEKALADKVNDGDEKAIARTLDIMDRRALMVPGLRIPVVSGPPLPAPTAANGPTQINLTQVTINLDQPERLKEMLALAQSLGLRDKLLGIIDAPKLEAPIVNNGTNGNGVTHP